MSDEINTTPEGDSNTEHQCQTREVMGRWGTPVTVTIDDLVERLEEAQATDQRRREYAEQQIGDLRRERNKAERDRDRLAGHLKRALAEAHAGKDPFTADSDEIAPLLVKAFRVARLLGHTQEGYEIARGLDVLHLWERSSNTERATGTESERRAEIDALVERSSDPIHPLDPRAEDVWKRALEVAGRANMCDEYERVAEAVGIPTDYEVSFSGTIDVSFRGTASIPVSGRATRAEIRNGEAFSIDSDDVLANADTYNLDWEVDDESVDYDGD